MRYIPIQPDVTLSSLDGSVIKNENDEPATISLKRFILDRLADPSLATDMDAVMSVLQMRDAVQRADDVIELESEDWKRLVAATKSPKGGYNPVIAHCLAPFMKAITEATEKRPETHLRSAAAE